MAGRLHCVLELQLSHATTAFLTRTSGDHDLADLFPLWKLSLADDEFGIQSSSTESCCWALSSTTGLGIVGVLCGPDRDARIPSVRDSETPSAI
mmetsp:Transcript_62932/g.147684  ORF Transcript_62932/g.147684 Transcript_62932/m.147684 type:complete len:94 (+) Transcript_62932:91-372(+)